MCVCEYYPISLMSFFTTIIVFFQALTKWPLYAILLYMTLDMNRRINDKRPRCAICNSIMRFRKRFFLYKCPKKYCGSIQELGQWHSEYNPTSYKIPRESKPAGTSKNKKEYRKAWLAKHPTYYKEWRATHPEYQKQWRIKNPSGKSPVVPPAPRLGPKP